MKRGDALKCKIRFRTESGKASEAGLVVGMTGTWFIVLVE
jgi:hypothetical protein